MTNVQDTYKLRRHSSAHITQRWVVLHDPLRDEMIQLWAGASRKSAHMLKQEATERRHLPLEGTCSLPRAQDTFDTKAGCQNFC